MEETILRRGSDSITCEGIDPRRRRAHPPPRTSTSEELMDRTALLRTTYRVNAVATFACAAALLGAGHLLAPLFAVPVAFVRGLGAFFVPFAAWIWAISRRPPRRRSIPRWAPSGLGLGYATRPGRCAARFRPRRTGRAPAAPDRRSCSRGRGRQGRRPIAARRSHPIPTCLPACSRRRTRRT